MPRYSDLQPRRWRNLHPFTSDQRLSCCQEISRQDHSKSQTGRLFITEAVEQQAYDLLHHYADHPFSFVDATSFTLMRQQRIRHAFAFDRHFATAGFMRIPADLQL